MSNIPNLLDVRRKLQSEGRWPPKPKITIDGIEHELPKYDGSKEIPVAGIAYDDKFVRFMGNFSGIHPNTEAAASLAHVAGREARKNSQNSSKNINSVAA